MNHNIDDFSLSQQTQIEIVYNLVLDLKKSATAANDTIRLIQYGRANSFSFPGKTQLQVTAAGERDAHVPIADSVFGAAGLNLPPLEAASVRAMFARLPDQACQVPAGRGARSRS